MELPDNIIKHYLRNVYFISGGLCGGKTTVAKYLAHKYKMILYNWDEKYPEHKAISDNTYQSEMNRQFKDWKEYFYRSPIEWSISLKKSIIEHNKIAIIDLINISGKKIIIVDGIFPFEIIKKITIPERCVFLYATMDVIRRDHFKRSDKYDMLNCIMKLKDPEKAKENVFKSSELIYTQDMKKVKESKFKYFIRDLNTNHSNFTQEIDNFFSFPKRE